MRKHTASAVDRMFQAMADASTWVLFKANRVRC